MSEMVDRVAEAIALAGNGGTWDDWYTQDQREFHRSRARAAIEAMREPTEAMWEAGDKFCGEWSPNYPWKAMIDTALEDK